MIVFEEPYFWKNPKWYYSDPRYGILRLTDKATPKAIRSFVTHYAHYVYGVALLPNSEEIVWGWVKEDLEDFKKNKKRYTMSVDKEGNQKLIKIDGVYIEQ